MPKPFFLFAPGAGAPSSHPWMQHWRQLLSKLGTVAVFDYDYMREGRRRLDPLPQLIAAHRQALSEMRPPHAPVVLIGKSMGSRIGCHVALMENVAAVVCFGYPLCGSGDRTRLRDKVLRESFKPILFVQGTRDALCPLDLLEEVRADMKSPTVLHIVEGGDHSLQVGKRDLKKTGRTQDEIDRSILDAIGGFIATACA